MSLLNKITKSRRTITDMLELEVSIQKTMLIFIGRT